MILDFEHNKTGMLIEAIHLNRFFCLFVDAHYFWLIMKEENYLRKFLTGKQLKMTR